MTGPLSPHDRRTLAAGALAIGAILLLARGLPAWRAWDAGARASAAEMASEAAAAERTVRLFPAALDSLEARRARLVQIGSGVLQGGSAAASGAELASLVSGAAARAGVQLGAVQLRADTAAAGTFRRVAVRVDGSGDLPSLLRLLSVLEGAPELLAVREIAIQQPHAGGPAEHPESLRLEMTVEALALVRGAALPADTAAPPPPGPPPVPVETGPAAEDEPEPDPDPFREEEP